MTRTAAVLAAALVAAPAPAEPKAATPAATPKSDRKASPDPAAPAPLEPGKYVAGRLADSSVTGRYHYWAVDLPAGEYLVVLDSHRSDGRDAHVAVEAQFYDPAAGKPVGRNVARTNTANGRDRGVGAFKAEAPGGRVIRVAGASEMAEYQLAVVAAGEPFGTPWLARPIEVGELKLGAAVTTPRLAGDDLFARDACYAVDLAEGDYRITAAFEGPGGRPAAVDVDLLDPTGKHRLAVLSGYASGGAGKKSGGIVVAGDGKVLVRVRGRSADVTATVTVGKAGE